MYYLYILLNYSKTKTYVGITDNVKRRLREHNSGRSFYTSKFGPWKLVYIECFENRNEARKREKYFKSAAGRKKIKKILQSIPG